MEEVELLGNEEDFDVILTSDLGIARQALLKQRNRRIRRGRPHIATGANATSRDAVLSKIHQIVDKQVIEDLAAQKKALVDTRLYFSVLANAVTSVDMISNSLPKATSLRNVANGKTDDGKWFLLTGMILKSGIADTPDDAGVVNTAFGALAKQIANGDFEFRINGSKHVLPKDTACSIFNVDRNDQPIGYFKLDNPKWIKPNTEMYFVVKTNAAIVANTAIRLELIGTSVETY